MESHVNRSATLRRLNGRTREGRKDAPRGGRRRACLARLAVTAAGGADLIAAARRSVRAAREGLGAVLQGHRSEEHTSELQSRPHLVCRLLLEKKKSRTISPEGSICDRREPSC